MRCLSWFLHFVLLVTTPSSLLASYQPPSTATATTTAADTVIRFAQNNLQHNHIVSYDEIIHLIEELEEGNAHIYTDLEFEYIHHFLAYLAHLGTTPRETADPFLLQQDIATLLSTDAHPYAYFATSDGSAPNCISALFSGERKDVLCGWWSEKAEQARKFVKKHKKAIVIGAVIIASGAVVLCAISTAAAAGTALVATAASSEPCHHPHKQENPPLIHLPSEESTQASDIPHLNTVLEEHIGEFKEALSVSHALSHQTDWDFIDMGRMMSAKLAHEVFEGINEFIPVSEIRRQMKALRDLCVPEKLTPKQEEEDFMFDQSDFAANGHKKIDEFFGTNEAGSYTPAAKAIRRRVVSNVIPLPICLFKDPKVSKFRQLIQSCAKPAAVAEQMGFSAQEISYLQQTGALEHAVSNTFEAVVTNRALVESFQKTKKAELFLEPYRGKFLNEVKLKSLIETTGMKTFPRPHGIPEHFKTKLTKKGAGILYVDPTCVQNSVRIMPGKPHSPNPCQQQPYVIQTRDGIAFDKFGNRVLIESPEAHIPLEEFVYRK